MDNARDIRVSVPSFQWDPNDSSTVLYQIEVTYKDGKSWLLLKRYSQFDDLNKNLKEYFTDLPEMPKKSYMTFFVGKSQDDIDVRRQGLDSYLKEVVGRHECYSSIVMRSFLELDKHTSQQIVDRPKLIGDFKGFVHGVRDFALDVINGLLFIVTADMNVMTRMDAYVTNMKMPWESERGEPTQISVGVLECWIRDPEGDYKRSWSKNYNSQAITVCWDQLTSSVMVGLDSGSINLLSVSKALEFKNFDESMEIELHGERIMGMFLDGTRSLLHSISKDKKYRVLNLTTQNLVADLELGAFELTYLHVDLQRRRSFIGDRGGSIYIFDMEPKKPIPVVHLETTLKFVRGLCVDSAKCFLFAVGQDEGELIVFDINKPGREGEAKQVAKLKNRSKSREICWSGSRGEIFVGNEDGTVTVWDAKTYAPIYVWKAHTEDITKLVWLESDITLLTAGKDKSIKAWKLPVSWMNKQLIEQEDKMAEQEQKVQQRRVGRVDSDEEDLGSWHK